MLPQSNDCQSRLTRWLRANDARQRRREQCSKPDGNTLVIVET
jgi:hypothetical protein